MARKFVSPGVFTQEIDRSYLAQGVANIGAAVVGLTTKGPAFAPTLVTDFSDFTAKFGNVDPNKMAPYAAKNYLKNSSAMRMVRVLGTGSNGWDHSATLIVSSGASGVPLIEIHVHSGTTLTLTSSNSTSFGFIFSGTGANSGTASFDSTSVNYITKALNTDPTKSSVYGHYVSKFFAWAGSGTGGPFTTASLSGAGANAYDMSFTTPVTPYVVDQTDNQLFRFYAISDGEAANTDVKITITGIKSSPFPSVTPYGTFDVVVRSFSDVDNRLVAVETYSGATLDPKSPNYLPRLIGDQYTVWDATSRKNIVNGTYKNRSRFIFVEMATGAWDKDSLPWGFTGYPMALATGGSAVLTVPYVGDNMDSNGNVIPTYWGVDFSQAGIADALKAYPASVDTLAGADFSLLHLSGSGSGVVYTGSMTTNLPLSGGALGTGSEGFTLAFYGGWDGWDPSLANPLPTGTYNSMPANAKISVKLAIDALSNPDEVDLNLLAIPGVTDNAVQAYARNMCNSRADCLYIMDIDGASVNAAVGTVNGLGVDDNYTACYYPDLRYFDEENGVQIQVKPSVAILGAYAFSDRVGQVWFAPAGLNRGGLNGFGIVDVVDRLTFQDRNDLYEARINPIASFPNEGITVFGQKTLQAKPSALDRVNVRRLLIYAKKTVASTAKYLLFEPNNPATWQKFLNTVNPILEDIRAKQGLERFKVVMDSTVNTPDLIDRNIMTGKIFLQPTKAAEFIDLSFIITASGVSFEE